MKGKQPLDAPDATYYLALKSSGQRPLFPERTLFKEFLSLLEQKAQCMPTADQPSDDHQPPSILAFCLLQHSIHLIIQPGTVNITELGQQFSQSYTHLYNKQHERHGSVFNKHMPCVLLEERLYLDRIIKQIHYLPVFQGLVASPSIYPWSSHNTYLDDSTLTWLHTTPLMQQIGQQRASQLRRYEHFMIMPPHEETDLAEGNQPHYHAWCSDEYLKRLLQPPSSNPLYVSAPTLDWLKDQVCEQYSLSINDLALRRRHRLAREVKAVITHLALGMGTTKDLDECAHFLEEDKQLLEGSLCALQQRQLFLHQMWHNVEQTLLKQLKHDVSIAQRTTLGTYNPEGITPDTQTEQVSVPSSGEEISIASQKVVTEEE